jgi:hypothetical protein
VVDHRAQRRDPGAASHEQQPLRRQLLRKQKGSEGTFEVDGTARRRLGKVRPERPVSFQRDQQFERLGLRCHLR